MKKTTELRIRILANWAKIFIVWGAASIVAFAIINQFTFESDAQAVGFLMLSPLFAGLIISPLLCWWSSNAAKYEEILKNKKARH